ncbi:hypothetical protein SCACP_26010 [Sporomusa carbonis]|jgi:hypothetical protein|uniref:hypothetical protein n=1 Tax=Sporomusa carbonis TaxID=3076075 RepID=UPI003A5F57F7
MQNQVPKGSTDYRDNERNEEIADVLTAISVVAKRLAQKLTMLARQENQKTEGGRLNEQVE